MSESSSHEAAICPTCGTEYPERDAKTEAEYECVECGAIGFDCCVPGKNSRCSDCEAKQEADE